MRALVSALVALCSVGVAFGHPTSAERHNSMGSCGAFGEAVAEGVWQWCYRNEQDNMNGCKARFRSWVREQERTCNERRRALGCSPGDHTAVQWHLHGTEAGERLRGDRAVHSCEDGTPDQAAQGVSPSLDREMRVRVQRALAAQGFDPGHPDGAFGPRTRGAIRSWQQANGHAASGELTGGQVEQLLSAAVSPGSAPGDLHGSIAFSQLGDGGYAFGIAWNAQGREEARRSAVEECGRRGGGGGCSEAGWFRNACGAIAIGDGNGYGTGWGETDGEAESSALSNCRSANRNCQVAMSRCVDRQYKEHEMARKPAGPICAGAAEGAKCWKELANKSGCYVWDNYLLHDQTVTWTGGCSEGVGIGRGMLVWTLNAETIEQEGTLRRGKKDQGQWVTRYDDGAVSEGPYVNGEKHGRWVQRYASGGRLELDYRNGSRESQPGAYITESGERYPGRVTSDGNCFRDHDGYAWVAWGSWDNCPNN